MKFPTARGAWKVIARSLHAKPARSSHKTRQIDFDRLEGKVVQSSGASLHAAATNLVGVSLNSAGDYVGIGNIDATHPQAVTFIAPRSGRYVFAAVAITKGLDPAIAVRDSSSRTLAFNNDATRATTNSAVAVNLEAGQQYYFLVVAPRNRTVGRVVAAIDGPAATAPLADAYARAQRSLLASINSQPILNPSVIKVPSVILPRTWSDEKIHRIFGSSF